MHIYGLYVCIAGTDKPHEAITFHRYYNFILFVSKPTIQHVTNAVK